MCQGSVNICLASDNSYAPYLKVMIYSVYCNRNASQYYDIIVLHTGIDAQNRRSIQGLSDKNFSVRLVDVSEQQKSVDYNVGAYYSVATNYRLLLFSELFSRYERMLYLDCDMIAAGDAGELFFCDMEGFPVAACEDVGFKQLSYTKRAIFIGGSKPYNADNYRTHALGMKHPEGYFNAGVVLFDLDKCRKLYSFGDVLKTLHSKSFHFNDQDTLNILFDGNVKQLDIVWNYQVNIEFFLLSGNPAYTALFKDMKREDFRLIHYISNRKPWNDTVPLGDFYHKYNNLLSEEANK